MLQYFFDTSALVKRYHKEDGTERVTEIFVHHDSIVRISTLGVVEIHSAFAVKMRSGQLSRTSADVLTDGVLIDLASARIRPFAVSDRHFAEAERLVRKFSYDYKLRSLDAIQLSVALDLHEQGLADTIVTADQTMKIVANLMGMPALNPQNHGR